MLFVLLLAITWSAEDVTPCKAAHRDVCPTTHLCTSITPVQSVPLYLRMSAEVNVFTCTMEPVSTISMQKALPRYRSDTDNLGAAANREHDIQKDAVIDTGTGVFETVVAVKDGIHVVLVAFEDLCQGIRQLDFILVHEYVHCNHPFESVGFQYLL